MSPSQRIRDLAAWVCQVRASNPGPFIWLHELVSETDLAEVHQLIYQRGCPNNGTMDGYLEAEAMIRNGEV